VDGEIFESGKKKLRIQKYLDMCGRGLRHVEARHCGELANKISLLKDLLGRKVKNQQEEGETAEKIREKGQI